MARRSLGRSGLIFSAISILDVNELIDDDLKIRKWTNIRSL